MRTIILVSVVGLFLLSTLPATSATAETSTPCYHYMYTSDFEANHYSLVKNNSVLIGNDLTVISNCEYVLKRGNVESTSSSNETFTLSYDTDKIVLITDNITYYYSNLTIYPAANMMYDNEVTVKSSISGDELFTSELLAHGITFAILFVVSTNVVYRIARIRCDNSVDVVI